MLNEAQAQGWWNEQVDPSICKTEILLKSWTIARMVTSKHRALSTVWLFSVCQAHTDIRDKQHVTAQKELWAEKAGDKFPFLLNIQFGSTSKCHWGKALRSYIFKYAEVRLRSMQESGHNINWLKFYFEADSTCGNSTICHYAWMGTEILGKEMGEDLCPV